MNKRLLPKAYAALLIFLALSPLYFLPAAALLPGRLWLAAVLPVPALLLTGIAGWQPVERRTTAFILALVLMAAVCTALLITQPLALLMYLPCAVTMLLFMPAMARPAHQEWSLKQLGFGIGLHIAAQAVKHLEIFAEAGVLLNWLFTVYLIAFLFFINRATVTETGASAPKTLLRQNRILLTGFCLLALLLANIRAIGIAIRAAITWIVQTVANIFNFLASLLSSQETPGGAQPADASFAGLMEEAGEPSLFARIMEIVLMVVAALLAAALLVFAIRQLWKLIRRLFALLNERLKVFRQRISADYDDSTENLLDWSELQKAAVLRLHRARQRILPTAWHKLSPAQQVRRVYTLLLRKADAPDPSSTAREMLESGTLPLPKDAAASTAALYDRARYSTHPISRQEADELRRQTGV